MATSFPSALDTFTDPASSDKLNNPSHSVQHQNHNDSVEAIEAKVGVNSSAVTTSHDYKLGEVTGSDKAVGKTATQTLTNKTLSGNTAINLISGSGTLTLNTTGTVTVPNATDTLVGKATTDTLTNKTLTAPTIADFTNANHDHGDTDDGGALATGAVTTSILSTELQKGWENAYGGTTFPTPDTVTNNGNRSYDCVFNSINLTSSLSAGMRLKLTRTVTAPTQCADLESGSSQYFSKTTPAGLTFTDDFTCMGWVKLESYTEGGIIARRNADTEGWDLQVTASGQVEIQALRIAGNNSDTKSYQSIPLNKWVHVAATCDLSGTSVLIYIDGVLVPSATVITGTITALVQGTTALVVGAQKSAGTFPFDGKIAQAAVFSAVLSAATIRSYMSQGLSGSETSLVSAYSLSNSLLDLTAKGSALATATYTPFTQTQTGITAGTQNYAIITAASFSTNTTLTVQVPEGDTIPTSGGVSAVSYSTQKAPYGFPADEDKWSFGYQILTNIVRVTPGAGTWYNDGGNITIPVGSWRIYYGGCIKNAINSSNNFTVSGTLSTANNTVGVDSFFGGEITTFLNTLTENTVTTYITYNKAYTSATVLYYNIMSSGATTNMTLMGVLSPAVVRITCAHL